MILNPSSSSMHGPRRPFRRRAAAPPPLPRQNPKPYVYFQASVSFYRNPFYLVPNPNLSSTHLPQNPFIQNPGFHPPPSPQIRPTPPNNREETLEKIERAVGNVNSDLLAAGEGISAYKVSQSALLVLEADSFGSLGFQLQKIPSLYCFIAIESKVNAFINCFVGVRMITSLHDLDIAICKNQGVDRFEDLGPEIWVEDFLNFIAKQKSVAVRERLGIRIWNLGWIASSIVEELHYPKDLFYDCEAVQSVLGAFAAYAVPQQVKSKKFLNDIRFKTPVTLDDALMVLQYWKTCETPFRASVAQMSKFYTIIWDGITTSKGKVAQEFRSGACIFVPFANKSRHGDVVSGLFLSPAEVYWDNPTGCVDRTKELVLRRTSIEEVNCSLTKTLPHIYPSLHDFCVNECGVHKIPPFCSYLQILHNLSSISLPSEAADAVLRVLLKWADDLKSGVVEPEVILYLKESLLKLENTVLPTLSDKWVSLHPSFCILCWCDDEELMKQFKYSKNLNFLYFGVLKNDEKEMISAKISRLMQTIGVPALSEVVSREAVFYGMEDCTEKASLVNWALPCAQHYLYKVHPGTYFHLKQSGYEELSQLQVVGVEKLFYKHTLRGCNDTSKKRYDCSSLLQGNALYVTRDSDYHSIFLELSRFFLKGSAELHLANFLHMIVTMAELGSPEEHTEYFIVSSQKVPKLPDEEPVWTLSDVSRA